MHMPRLITLLLPVILLLPLASLAGEMQIKGDDKFQAQIAAALALLEKQAPAQHQFVYHYIGKIEQAPRSGMRAYDNIPTLQLNDRTTFYSLTWAAGSIAHDACHSRLYLEYKKRNAKVPDHIWIGKDAENTCLAYQLSVLKEIGAPVAEIEYFKTISPDYYDPNKNGKFNWDDYRKRNW